MNVLICGPKASTFREFRTPFPRAISAKIHAACTRVCRTLLAQFVLKVEKLSHVIGTAPILEIARAYSLRPRLWLLYVFNNRIVATSLLWLSQNTVYITFPHSQKLMHCRIGLPLPIHTIKCSCNHPLVKVK